MKLKERPEDFKVWELLKEEPSKERRGKYRYYKLFKVGMETLEAIDRVAKISGIRPFRILYGGLKDKNAQTFQFVAVREPLKLKEFSEKNLKLEFSGWLDSPPAELLKGNRFEIKVGGVGELKEERLRVLRELGVPNYYGQQRFTPVRGGRFFVLELLKGPREALTCLFTPAGWESSRGRRAKRLFVEGKFSEAARHFKGWRKRVCKYLAKGGSWEGALGLVPKSEFEFQANVFQSYLFNRLLSQVVKESEVKSVKFKYKLGYLYYPLERITLPEYLPSFTLDTPVYDAFLRELGVKREELLPVKDYLHPFKRLALVKPEDLRVERTAEGFLFRFSLPPGSYATNTLRFLFSAV